MAVDYVEVVALPKGNEVEAKVPVEVVAVLVQVVEAVKEIPTEIGIGGVLIQVSGTASPGGGTGSTLGLGGGWRRHSGTPVGTRTEVTLNTQPPKTHSPKYPGSFVFLVLPFIIFCLSIWLDLLGINY